MNPLIRLLIRLAIIFVVIFVAIQPFNWYCQLTQKCQTFSLSYYLPHKEGTEPVNVAFEIKSYREDLEIEPLEPTMITVVERKNTVIYHAKNLSSHLIRFRPILRVEPEALEKYIVRYECLCSSNFKLKVGEAIQPQMRFSISHKIYDDPAFKNLTDKVIKIRYEIQ